MSVMTSNFLSATAVWALLGVLVAVKSISPLHRFSVGQSQARAKRTSDAFLRLRSGLPQVTDLSLFLPRLNHDRQMVLK